MNVFEGFTALRRLLNTCGTYSCDIVTYRDVVSRALTSARGRRELNRNSEFRVLGRSQVRIPDCLFWSLEGDRGRAATDIEKGILDVGDEIKLLLP